MENIACGVDIGGTKLAAGLVDLRGKLIDKTVVYGHGTEEESAVILMIRDLVRDLLDKHKIDENTLSGIGIGFPGHIRTPQGITIRTSNLDTFKNFPLKKEIEKHFDTKIVADNDANAQAFAEFKYGAGRGYSNMIFITVSSGVGAGVIIDNKIYRGITGTAGEFGHMIVNPEGEIKCGCGNYGCLMTYTCGHALGKIFKKHLEGGMKTRLKIDKNTPPQNIDGQLLKIGLKIDDPLTKMVVDQCALYMGIGIYNLFQIFNPSLFVLGGGLINLGDYLFEQIKSHFYRLARDMIFDDISIKHSELCENAGIIGAASLLLEEP
jgi:glucokinase